jgi:uncharacterized paraquat-inducible protein A
MVSGKRKWIYAGLLVAAMLISPGATPMGDFILFVALSILVEASIVIAKVVEHQVNDGSKSALEKWFSTETCKYCNTKLDKDQTNFCPNCKRSMK